MNLLLDKQAAGHATAPQQALRFTQLESSLQNNCDPAEGHLAIRHVPTHGAAARPKRPLKYKKSCARRHSELRPASSAPPDKPRSAKHLLGPRLNPLCKSSRAITPTRPALADFSARTSPPTPARAACLSPLADSSVSCRLKSVETDKKPPADGTKRTVPHAAAKQTSSPCRTSARAQERTTPHRGPCHIQVKHLAIPSTPIAPATTQTTLLAPGLRDSPSRTPARSSQPSCPSTCPLSQPCNKPPESCKDDRTHTHTHAHTHTHTNTHSKRESRSTTATTARLLTEMPRFPIAATRQMLPRGLADEGLVDVLQHPSLRNGHLGQIFR